MHYRRGEIKGSHNVRPQYHFSIHGNSLTIYREKTFLPMQIRDVFDLFCYLCTEQQNTIQTLVNQGVFNFLTKAEKKHYFYCSSVILTVNLFLESHDT